MRQLRLLALMVLTLAMSVNAATVIFDTNPLDGDPALTTPGRQIVNGAGGGPVFSFDPAADVISFDLAAFGVPSLQFFRGNAADFPTGGTTIALVQDAAAAGAAATALANQITTPGAGFFMYFNAGLNVPRLVFSTDLDDPTADLAILGQFTNLVGQTDVLGDIQAANFTAVPEPSSLLLTAGALAGACLLRLRRKQ